MNNYKEYIFFDKNNNFDCELPVNSGAYRIFIFIKRSIKIKLGALGILRLQKGNYIYTGSAMKNLRQRVERHLKQEKKIRWHIDYLLANKYVEIDKIIVYPSIIRNECVLNQQMLELPGTKVPIPGFGSSDCKICPAHLLKLE